MQLYQREHITLKGATSFLTANMSVNPSILWAKVECSALSFSFFPLSFLLPYIEYYHVRRVIVDLKEEKSRGLKLHASCFFPFVFASLSYENTEAEYAQQIMQ